MANISVANYSVSGTTSMIGQSFDPCYPGPDGSGPLSASRVALQSIALGFPTYDLACRPTAIYVYDVALTNRGDIGRGANLVATSTSYSDTPNLGPSAHARTFYFAVELPSDATYYIYFGDGPQTVCLRADNAYVAGAGIDYNCDEDPQLTLQFEVRMLEVF